MALQCVVPSPKSPFICYKYRFVFLIWSSWFVHPSAIYLSYILWTSTNLYQWPTLWFFPIWNPVDVHRLWRLGCWGTGRPGISSVVGELMWVDMLMVAVNVSGIWFFTLLCNDCGVVSILDFIFFYFFYVCFFVSFLIWDCYISLRSI